MLIQAGDGQSSSVRRKNQALDSIGLIGDNEGLSLRPHIPDADGPVIRARREPLAIGGKRQRQDGIRVSLQ